MKNIIIAGIPRSGKTTLSKKLFRELHNYNLLQQDVINAAVLKMYKHNFAKIEGDKFNQTVNINVSEVNRISNEIFWNIYNNSNNDKNMGIILETFDISMEELKKYQDKGDIVIVLGCPELTEEQFLNNIRKYDTPNDRTYYLGDFRLSMEIEYYVKRTKEDKSKCQELGLTYIDTSKDRDIQLNKAFKIIQEKLTK